MSSFDNCRSCRETIRWARTPKGKNIPLDPAPTAEGNIRLTPRGRNDIAYVLTGIALESARARKDRLYKSHFATCPEADRWRRSGDAQEHGGVTYE